jgi:hypothetical protein
MIKDGNHEDYTVDYVDERNFVLKDSNDAVVFTTVDNKKYTFQEIDRENIGKYMPMLKRTQLSVRVEDNQMRDSRDMITLAATLTYLHRKLRPVHIIGGLKLLGFTLPLLYLMKSWYDLENITQDKAFLGDKTADDLASFLKKSTHLSATNTPNTNTRRVGTQAKKKPIQKNPLTKKAYDDLAEKIELTRQDLLKLKENTTEFENLKKKLESYEARLELDDTIRSDVLEEPSTEYIDVVAASAY